MQKKTERNRNFNRICERGWKRDSFEGLNLDRFLLQSYD